MINIRYSTGSCELKAAEVERCTSTNANAASAFNKVDIPTSDFVGVSVSSVGTVSTRPKVSYTHPRQNYSSGRWDITNGITVIFKEDEGGFYGASISLYLNNNSAGYNQQYYDDGELITTSSHVAQASVIKLVPTSDASDVGRVTLEFYGKNRSTIEIVSVIIGGELVEFDKILSASLVEEMNIIGDDLPINEFDFSAVCSQDLAPGNKLSVYSNEEYFGTFWVDDVEKISQNYAGTEKVYTVECVNAIGLLDKCIFENCTYTLMNGPCSGESSLGNELRDGAGLSYEIERGDPNANYGILGLVPVQTLRYYVCEFGWAICKWVCTARRDNIYFRMIPNSVANNRIITDDYIIGNSTYKKNKPITSATWTHPMENINWKEKGGSFSMDLPAGDNCKIYYDNPPAWIDINTTAFTVARWTANYFIYSTSELRRNIGGFVTSNINVTESIQGRASPIANAVSFDSFNCVGMKNYEVKSASECGLITPQAPHNFYVWLFKKGTFDPDTKDGTPINSDNLIISQKITDIQKYIKSAGTVTATIILKDELADLQVGEMVTIATAFDGNITGIVTKMDISFGYYNTAKIEIRESSAFLSN